MPIRIVLFFGAGTSRVFGVPTMQDFPYELEKLRDLLSKAYWMKVGHEPRRVPLHEIFDFVLAYSFLFSKVR